MDLLTYYTAHGLATVWSCNCKNGIVRQVDWLVRDISSLTLITGCHLRLKLSKILYSGMYCLFLLIRNVIFQQQVNTMAFFIVVFALLSRHFESPIATRLYLKGYPASRAFFILMHFIKYMLIYIQPHASRYKLCRLKSVNGWTENNRRWKDEHATFQPRRRVYSFALFYRYVTLQTPDPGHYCAIS